MPVESPVNFISDLVATNPIGATDPKSQGDDHIRNLKTAIKATFPNVTGAVTATQAELNIIDGVTASTAELNILEGVTLTAAQINDVVLKAGATQSFSNAAGVLEFRPSANFRGAWRGDVASTLVWQMPTSGIAIKDSANANTRFSITDAGAASFAVSLAVAGIAHTDWARLSQNNTFTGVIQSVDGTDPLIRARAASATVTVYMRALDAGSGIVGMDTNHPLDVLTNATSRLRIAANGDFDFKAGTVTTNNASASEVGFKGMPIISVPGSATISLGTSAGMCNYSGGGGDTLTIPANAGTAVAVGTVIGVINTGAGNLTIAITSDTLVWAGPGSTGSRTLASKGWATLIKMAATTWYITGTGIS